MNNPLRRLLRRGVAALLSDHEAAGDATVTPPPGRRWRMPDEREPHARTFMAWPPLHSEWGAWVRGARDDIADIARTLAEYEPVVLLARPGEAGDARRQCEGAVDVWPVPVDDLWARDTAPLFVVDEPDNEPAGPGEGDSDGEGASGRGSGRKLTGIDLGFNGWGGRQAHSRDHRVARRVLRRTGVPRVRPPLTAEGGSFEVDGEGTLLATESSLVHDNRNPGRDRDSIEATLRTLLGVQHVIWVPGVRDEDITDCHVDALARFTEPGVVVLSRPSREHGQTVWVRVYEQALAVLKEAKDAHGRSLEIVELPEATSDPGRRSEGFLPSYVNYYVANGVVVVPRFGDRSADTRAAGLLGELYPGRAVRQVPADTVAEGGGGIHCATQQQPKV